MSGEGCLQTKCNRPEGDIFCLGMSKGIIRVDILHRRAFLGVDEPIYLSIVSMNDWGSLLTAPKIGREGKKPLKKNLK
jgi:hypothetical protein